MDAATLKTQTAVQNLTRKFPATQWPEVIANYYMEMINDEWVAASGVYDHNENQVWINPDLFSIPMVGSALFSAALAHEFGHPIFLYNLAATSRLWADVVVRIKPVAKSDARRGRAVIKFMHTMPYQELFSDVLVVMLYNDPDIMKWLAAHINPADQDAIMARSFTGELKDREWIFEDVHQVFRPVRHWLWRTHLAGIKNHPRRPELLRQIFDSIVDELNSRIVHGKFVPLAPEVMNVRLLRRLEADLAPLN